MTPQEEHLTAQVIDLVKENRKLKSALLNIKEVLAKPASNRTMMQIAGPARQCLNIIHRLEDYEGHS